MFRAATPASEAPASEATRLALDALGGSGGGTVLDVGCGGGAAGLALVPPAVALTGVDESAAMLAALAEAAAEREVACHTVEGRWPDVALSVDPADVVVCHHVVYNVADVVPFLVALSDHARRAVVVELTESHPAGALNPLWERFWGLARPTGPTADDFVEVVHDLGYRPVVRRETRPPRRAAMDRAGYVAFARRRLCLPAERDPEVDAALGDRPVLASADVVAVSWTP
ncbi:MAG: methyltransferase [Acidimicrobiales bacterium]